MARDSRLQGKVGLAREVWRQYQRDRIPLPAAAIAFYMFLSLIPLLLLLISVAAFFVTPGQAQALAGSITSNLGVGVGNAVQSQILSVVENRGLLTGISLLVGLWAGSQIFTMLELALNQVWEVEDKRSFWVRRGLALLMVLVTGVLAILAIALTYLIHLVGRVNLPLIGELSGSAEWVVVGLLSILAPVLLISLAFAIIYKYLPATKVRWDAVIPGALFAGVIWVIVLQLFSWYTANIADYHILYGSLGELILLLLWFNYSAQIMLIGAEIAAVIQGRREVLDVRALRRMNGGRRHRRYTLLSAVSLSLVQLE